MTESYIPARPTIYHPLKGGPPIEMRSRLEAHIAAALDNRGFDWDYEPQAYATWSGQYLPDFLVRDVRTMMANEPIRTGELLIEVVATESKFEARHGREVAIIGMATDTPLLYTGWGSGHPHLFGWCFTSDSPERKLAALGLHGDNPGLYLELLAYAWIDGYWQHAKDTIAAPN